MKASDIKKVISLLAPCLGDSSVLVALKHLCFTNEGVYAFNDLVATFVRWEHDIGVFGVEGKEFAGILSSLGNKEVELSLEGGSANRLIIKSGKAVSKIPTIGESHFIWEDKPQSDIFTATITEKQRLMDALDTVAVSAKNPVYNSVVFAAKAGTDRLMAYTTTGVQIVHACVGKTKTKLLKDRVWIVPKLAVQQIIAISDLEPKAPLIMKFSKEAVACEVKDVLVTSKVITDATPNFEAAIKGEEVAVIPKWKANERLVEAVSQATSVYNVYQGVCSFILEDNELSIVARSPDGSEYKDEVKLPGSEGSIGFHADPNLLEHSFAMKSIPDDAKAVLQREALIIGNPLEFLYGASFAPIKDTRKTTTAEE